jgi:membrane-bound lytic murein transglycosylase B
VNPLRRSLLALAGLLASGPPALAAARRHATVPAGGPAYGAPGKGPAYAGRADVQRFAAEVAARRDLPRHWLAAQLAQARRLQAVRKLVMPAPAGTAKDWSAYRARFIEPRRIAAGAEFWRTNQDWLTEAEARWGVPPEIVVGIVGVETFYGRLTGGFRTLDALATLAFDFPPGRKDRSAFFRAELEEFFVFCARDGHDPQAVKGSYAGAMGLPQFMPGSLNRHAVDLDGDGRIDLQGSAADAIGSVANYLAAAGWQRGQPTHYEVTPPAEPDQRATLLLPDILPSFSAAQMAALGAVLDVAGREHTGPLALVELHNGKAAPSFVAGTQNFYVVTRYNWSAYYAMAVIELGLAVGQSMQTR